MEDLKLQDQVVLQFQEEVFQYLVARLKISVQHFLDYLGKHGFKLH
jgi:hypothetical protein